MRKCCVQAYIHCCSHVYCSGPSHAGSAADSKAVHEEVQHLHTELRSLALRMSGIEIQVAGLAAEYQEHMGLQATRHAQLLEGMVLLNARHAQQVRLLTV